MANVTRILNRWKSGSPQTSQQLLPLVYEELRKLAAARLARELPGQTLQATALVHEAYLRLAGSEPDQQWDGREHFFAAAAEAMRRILVENARRKRRRKHGGELCRVEVELSELPTRMSAEDLLALDEALVQLREQDAVKAQLVTLRYFGGLSIEQAASVLKISRMMAYRHWTFARAWLHHKMTGGERQELETA